MSATEFRQDPWKHSHEAYEQSTFNIRPAPEFATAEVVLASLYRSVGYPGYREGEVPAAGREFVKDALRPRPRQGVHTQVSQGTWSAILHEILESPKQPNQSSKRFLQLSPVVPDVALYSGSARLTTNSWNPGQLVQRMIRLGAGSEGDARRLWTRLQRALSVTTGDDIWARWLQGEFETRRRAVTSWTEAEWRESSGPWLDEEGRDVRVPAQQYVRDLSAIIDAKHCMTRKQWISLLESVLRLGVVTHVLWLCDVNDRLWRTAREVLEGHAPPPDAAHLRRDVVTRRDKFLAYGTAAVSVIRAYASRYLNARLGLNLLLWELDALGRAPTRLSTSADLAALMATLADLRGSLDIAGMTRALDGIKEEHARTIACKKGIGSNLVEFGRHVLGQRQAAHESLRGYDQGYFLKQRSERGLWMVSMGPVAVLALVHCCLREAAGPRSVQRLCEHLDWYGLDVDRDDIAKSELGRMLRMLGLVLDSPDAESGMLLVPPFDLLGATGAHT